MENIVEQTKRSAACCGGAYRNDAVRMILGDAWHPGGLELTGRLASKLGIRTGDLVLDAACGIGTTARYLATNFGCAVIGVDHSFQNAREATKRQEGDVRGMAEFGVGESTDIPLPSDSADAVIMECVLSSFDDKRRSVAEAARILKPGGKLGVSDVVVDGKIPEALSSPSFQAFCVSGALSTGGYRELLRASWLENVFYEDEAEAAAEFVDGIRRKIFVAQLLVGVGKPPTVVSSDQLIEVGRLLSMARRSIQERALGYGLFVARKR